MLEARGISAPSDVKKLALDLDDKNEITARETHIIPVTNLKPSRTYYFSIVSGDTTFLNNGKPFNTTTAPVIESPDSNNLEVMGKVIFDNPNINDALIYITSEKMQPFVTKVRPDGTYSLTQKQVRTSNLSSFLSIKENDIMQMLIASSSKQSNISIFAKDLKNIPTVILSNNYDFTISSVPIATSSAVFGFPSLVASPSANKVPQIINPEKNEELIDTRPVFRGIASPSAEVNIEIHSDENIKTTVVADSKGNWTFRPTTSLSPGPHTINISTRDAFGIIKTITQSFTVYAQGSQVSQNATPSATLAPSATPVEPTPTVIVSPTIIISQTELPTETPVEVTISPNSPVQMQPPGDISSMLLGIGAFAATIFGVVLVLLSIGIL